MKQPKFYQTVKVTHVPFDDLHEETHVVFPLPALHVIDLLTLISHLPIEHQCFILLNLLTVTGFEQKEIAESLAIDYQSFRLKLMKARKMLRENA